MLGKWASDYTGNLMPTGTALPLPYTSSSGVVIEYPTVVQLHETHLFSPNLLNTFSAAVTRLFIPILSNTAAGKYPEKGGVHRSARETARRRTDSPRSLSPAPMLRRTG